MTGPLPRWCEDTCVVCPARALGPGEFDVLDAEPGRYRLDRAIGWRVDEHGTAVCVHPYRVGLPEGRYASGHLAVPDPGGPRPAPSELALVLPEDETDLEGWLVAVLRVAEPDALMDSVALAERQASSRFAPAAVTAALRRVLSHELAHHD